MHDDELSRLLPQALEKSLEFLAALPERPVRATRTAAELRQGLQGPLPPTGEPAAAVIAALAEAAREGTVASAGPRYFGFVTGGRVPAALAADWLVATWDQNAALHVMSPLVSVIEEITAGWLLDLAGLPASMSTGFVSGCQMANFTALAAARHQVLRDAGWDVEAQGLFGAPPIQMVISEEAHHTIIQAVRLLGLGAERVRRVATDAQGRMRVDALQAALTGVTGPCIVCAQAGNVNTGAFDPLEAIAAAARKAGAWLHVDGAFGLWAAASPALSSLVRGVAHADSVATDAHKWLNVPYDCGLVFCAHPAAHRTAMSLAAAYLAPSEHERDSQDFVPESSRRARAVPVYAALRALGRQGLAQMVERHCRQARTLAQGLTAAGLEVLNEVVLNQVLVAFGDEHQTRRTIAALQAEGTCWCGSTHWHGRTAMRISVCNASTRDEDIQRSLAAIVKVAAHSA